MCDIAIILYHNGNIPEASRIRPCTPVDYIILMKWKNWQARPLDALYPIIHLDCIHAKVRDNGAVRVKAVYLALGVNLNGDKELPHFGYSVLSRSVAALSPRAAEAGGANHDHDPHQQSQNHGDAQQRQGLCMLILANLIQSGGPFAGDLS